MLKNTNSYKNKSLPKLVHVSWLSEKLDIRSHWKRNPVTSSNQEAKRKKQFKRNTWLGINNNFVIFKCFYFSEIMVIVNVFCSSEYIRKQTLAFVLTRTLIFESLCECFLLKWIYSETNNCFRSNTHFNFWKFMWRHLRWLLLQTTSRIQRINGELFFLGIEQQWYNLSKQNYIFSSHHKYNSEHI